MTELLGWMMVIGLAVAITGIFLLFSEIERRTRQTLEAVLQSNAMIMAQLERVEDGSPKDPDGLVGVVLDWRHGESRRDGQPETSGATGPVLRVVSERRPEGTHPG